MNKNQVAVVLPIYKKEFSPFEEISFQQCLVVLNEYPIIIVCPKEIKNCNFHQKYCNKIQFIFLEDVYFETIKSYNFLMLSKFFYELFLSYKYILIYQLDCFVFKDELLLWADKGYSFIGSPWFNDELNKNNTDKMLAVGNGGFSLRNVQDCINVLKSSKKIFLFKEHLSNLKQSKRSFAFFRSLKHFVLKPEKIYYSFKTIRNYPSINEDEIFAIASKRFEFFKVPDSKIALSFAFEKSPQKSYLLNNQQLPFGCHAWYKYGIKFYKPFFKEFGFEIDEI